MGMIVPTIINPKKYGESKGGHPNVGVPEFLARGLRYGFGFPSRAKQKRLKAHARFHDR